MPRLQRWFLLLAAAWLAGAGCAAAADPPSPIRFDDVTAASGVAFRHTDGGRGTHYLVQAVGSGVASFDYDGDGLLDLYFLNGRPLRGSASKEPGRNALYRNLGGFRFVDVTDRAGVGNAGYGMGVCLGDYDNDGLPDIYVNNFGRNVLYRNRGDGTFEDVAAKAGVTRGETVGAGANFLDIDGDGHLDLFVANYIAFTYENHVTAKIRGAEWFAGPLDFPAQPNRLFRNRGDGMFDDVSVASGIAAHAGTGMGSVAFDADGDGATDIFVCNDQAANFLFRNDGRGTFAEAALAVGVACNYAGEFVGGMGADCGDFDRDGLLDLFMTDFEAQKVILFRNLGGGAFEDVTLRAGAAAGSLPYVKWGCGFADFDNDGYPDLFIGCGHLGDDHDPRSGRSAHEVTPVVLRNNGRGRFVDVSRQAGPGLQKKLVARGVALDDFDNDGRIDVAVLNLNRPATLLRNVSPTNNHWLQVRLRGVKSNRDGVGARVRVVAGEFAQFAEVVSGRGYQSHFGSRLHFGLGQRGRVNRVEVHWLGGGVDVVEDLAVDRMVTVVEGRGLE